MFLTGRAVWLAGIGIVAVALAPRAETVLLWAGIVVALVIIDVALAPSPRRITVTRQQPVAVRLDEAAQTVLILTNTTTRKLALRVRDAWAPSAGATENRHQVSIPARQSRRIRTPLLPTRRGERKADLVTVRSLGPLTLAGRQASHEAPASLMVLPPFRSRKHLPSRLALLREMDGRAAILTRGEGTEFDSLREYVIGDDVRAIDWRATARSGDVVVRTWRPERDRRVLIVIDTGRLSAVRLGDETRLDAQIEATLLLAALASHAGDRVDVVALDTEVRARVAGERGPKLMNALAEKLAPLEPSLVETSWTQVAAVVRQQLSQRALVVLLTALDPSMISNGILPVAKALAANHTTIVAAASDPSLAEMRDQVRTPADAFLAAAAERTDLERDVTEYRLRSRGVEVVEAASSSLAPALADAYLRLKRAGRL